MIRALLTITILLGLTSAVYAEGGHAHHAIPTMPSTGDTKIAIDDHTVTLTFGPVDLPSGHDGDLASSMPKKVFQLPDDTYMIGYKSEVFTKDGQPLPKNYLHHILMLNNDKPSVSCDGEPLFFAGAGLEMTEARFPDGYGVKLGKDQNLMSVAKDTASAPYIFLPPFRRERWHPKGISHRDMI